MLLSALNFSLCGDCRYGNKQKAGEIAAAAVISEVQEAIQLALAMQPHDGDSSDDEEGDDSGQDPAALLSASNAKASASDDGTEGAASRLAAALSKAMSNGDAEHLPDSDPSGSRGLKRLHDDAIKDVPKPSRGEADETTAAPGGGTFDPAKKAEAPAADVGKEREHAPKVLADVVESLLGAVFLDSGCSFKSVGRLKFIQTIFAKCDRVQGELLELNMAEREMKD